MNKTTKKRDNQVVKALTNACELAKTRIKGFEWLTHSANYADFPGGLMVRCVFDSEESIKLAKQNQHQELLIKLIHAELLRVGVLLKSPKRHVVFDSEEACLRDHDGSWKQRLNNLH